MGAPAASEPVTRGAALSVQRPPHCATGASPSQPSGPRTAPLRQVHLADERESELSKRIYAAKPTTWRGQGDLLQCPWVLVPKGTLLVIDLWSGIGGLPIALLCMGATIYTVSAESDPVARRAAAQTMPNMIHLTDVAQVRARDFQEFIARRQPRAVLIGGGSPCQGNSSLNTQRKGLDDPRSHQPVELCRIRDEFQTMLAGTNIAVLTFLENVGSMPRNVRQQYTSWLGHEPVRVNAIHCGWVHRNRLFWLGCGDTGVAPSLTPPVDWQWAAAQHSDPPVLQFCGKKPVPPKISWEAGFSPLFNPLDVRQGATSLGFHPFTREFHHPSDWTAQSSAQAVERFYADSCRFPPSAYEEHSLLWRGILAILSFLPQLMAAKIPKLVLDYEEVGLRSRLLGTVWEPGRIDAFPDLIHSASLAAGLQEVFRPFVMPDGLWSGLEHRFSHCQLHRLQYYAAWCRMRGLPWQSLGPLPLTGRDRTAIFAGLSGQRYPATSSRGLDHLLPPDVTFLVQALVIWRQFLTPFACELRTILRTLATALRPLEAALDKHRCFASQRVAASKRSGFVAAMSILLRWPDLQQPIDLVAGYSIVGDFASTGVFRPVQPGPATSMADWLGPAAERAVENILRSPPPRFADEILRITLEEQDKGFCGEFLTKAQVDALHGAGAWRPMERFLIQQADGKTRAIDNCRRTGHNAATTLYETITTVNVDAIATFSRMVCDALELATPPEDRFPWLDLRIGTDDLPDAYRGLPVAHDQMPYSYVAIHVPAAGWRFTPMYGLAYGLESAVVSFNRFPQLGVAIARRCCLAFCAAYFDDELAVEFLQASDTSQLGLRLAFTAMGAAPQASKAFRPAANRHYLGTSIHVGDFLHSGTIRFQPKTSTRTKVSQHISSALAVGALDRDTAGKLRGDLNWMFSNCAGHIGRFAGPVLTTMQAAEVPDLSPENAQSLRILLFIVQQASPRDICVCGPPKPLLRIYSDASFEDGQLRVGWICMPPGRQPLGGTCLVPDAVIQSWTPRKQQIFPGEALAGLLVPWFHAEIFSNFDVLWFVDNEAAASSLIRGSSREGDVHAIAQFAHLLFHTLNSRGTLRVAGLFSLGLLMDMGPLSAVAKDVKPFERFLSALGARQSASDRPLPEAMVPEKLMQEMVNDKEFVDLRIDCNDGSVWAHRIVCCKVCCELGSKLVQSTDRPDHWCLEDKAPCSSQTLAVMKDIIYSGRVDSHQIDQMSDAERQECLRTATWFGMAYAQEWLQQYIHYGAHPEELATAEIKMPKHWNQMPIQHRWRLESVSSQHVLGQLQKVLIPHDANDLGHGRDCRGNTPYNFLELHRAWRIENFHLWRKFQHEVLSIKDLKKNQSLAMPQVSIRKALVEATQNLPEPVGKDINEVFLLHGTKPPSVKKILSDGLNERFSGGLFGHGSYLAEDPAKSDQYATPDARGDAVQGHVDEPPRNVCYMFLCRAVLGRFVQTKDGEKSLQDGKSIWSTPDKREFNTIPRFDSPYHSLQVETGFQVQRHREYILTHSERIYPEYLIAYKRQYRR
eukprot:s2946_g6.t1